MRFVKNGVHRALSMLGYKIVRESSVQPVRPENFANLARAFELELNHRLEAKIPWNETRAIVMARLLGTPPSEAYFIVRALAQCRLVDGDVCEFGVAQGETSALIANEISAGGKSLHLFDSFEGLPKPSQKDHLKDDIFSLGTIEAYAGTMACSEHLVQARLQAVGLPSSRYVIHKGFIEDVLARRENLPRIVSFAYVDFDFYEPIRAALDFLHDITPAGAVIIVDDYDFFSTGAKAAVDEFMSCRNESGAYVVEIPDPGFGHFAVLTRLR